MDTAEKKFRLSAILAIFVLLALLLAVINIVSFTMAAADADALTERIASRGGSLTRPRTASAEPQPSAAQPQYTQGRNPLGRLGPMGAASPETEASSRYFTVVFPPDGQDARLAAYEISAVSEEEAVEWARGLVRETTGWTSGTYRYRVYEYDGLTCVTVVDQGREMLAPYRILLISLIGGALCLVISFFVLRTVGRRLFAPLEEADRKQKKFIAGANREFRLPLTIINADAELLEKAHGPDDQTRSIHRQVRKMDELVSQLESLAIFEQTLTARSDVQLSDLLRSSLDGAAERFRSRGLTAETDIAPDITLLSEPEAMKRIVDELTDNAVRYAKTRVSFTLRKQADRILLVTQNDTELPDGPCDQVFDRFTTLENAPEGAIGLGLSGVRDAVKAHDGRAGAVVTGGMFTLRIAL